MISDAIPGTNDTGTCNYTHDDLARVASVNCGNTGWRQNFSYDAFGNITKDSTGYTGQSFMPGYSPATNQFTSLPGITPTYDGNGRLTSDGANTYTWSVYGKLATVDTSPSSAVTYDASGRMVEKLVGTTYTQVVYGPSGSKLAVMTGQTLVKAFIPLPGGGTAVYTASGLTYYRHVDHLGSSRLATTPTRTLYSSTAYAPYGETIVKSGQDDPNFTGQDQDTAPGMYDFMARRFTAVSGRWLSPDPVGLGAVDPSNPQTWNRYAYVYNNPLSLIDPLGEDCYTDGTCWTGAQTVAQLLGLAYWGGWADPFAVITAFSQQVPDGYHWEYNPYLRDEVKVQDYATVYNLSYFFQGGGDIGGGPNGPDVLTTTRQAVATILAGNNPCASYFNDGAATFTEGANQSALSIFSHVNVQGVANAAFTAVGGDTTQGTGAASTITMYYNSPFLLSVHATATELKIYTVGTWLSATPPRPDDNAVA